MTKARILADFISDGSSLADGTISVAEVSGAAPLASPTFTGTVVADAYALDSIALPSAGTATIFNRNTDSSLYIQTSSGNTVYLLDSSQNTMYAATPTSHSFAISNVVVNTITATESVFNEGGVDRDFRVESDTDANALFVQGSDGNVGIGTSSPTANITIDKGLGGSSVTTFTTANSYLQLGVSDYNSSGGVYAIGFGYSGGATHSPAYIGLQQTETGSYTKGDLVFRTRSTSTDVEPPERMRIDSLGGLITNPAAGGHAIFNEGGIDADFRVESDASPYAFYMDAGANSGYGRTKITSSAIYSNTSAGGGTSDTYINGLTIENNEATYTNGGLALVNKYSWGYGSAIKWYNIYDGAGTGGTLGETNSIHSQYVSANNMDTVFSSMISGALTETLSIGANGTVVNDGAIDNDFRVESVGNGNMLNVDAGNNCVNIATTQTEAMFGGGSPSNGYVQQFTGAKLIKCTYFDGLVSTPSETVTSIINVVSYSAITVRLISSGCYWNNGSAFYTRVTDFVLAIEGSTARINAQTEVFAEGTQIGNCAVPSASVSGTNQFQITQVIGAGYTNDTFLEVTGKGGASIGSITKA
jgi:hypothetical protein